MLPNHVLKWEGLALIPDFMCLILFYPLSECPIVHIIIFNDNLISMLSAVAWPFHNQLLIPLEMEKTMFSIKYSFHCLLGWDLN